MVWLDARFGYGRRSPRRATRHRRLGRAGSVKLLLDTHIWLWALLEPERLTAPVSDALQSPENELWLSPISVWEATMLAERGRVVVRISIPEPYRDHRAQPDLPRRKLMDRMIAAHALVHRATVVTINAPTAVTSPASRCAYGDREGTAMSVDRARRLGASLAGVSRGLRACCT